MSQALQDLVALETELIKSRDAGAITPEHLMSLTERLSLVTTPALREGHLLLDRVGRNDRGAAGVLNQVSILHTSYVYVLSPGNAKTNGLCLQLKEVESKRKTFDHQLREEIGKISEKSETYHEFRETYSFVSLSVGFKRNYSNLFTYMNDVLILYYR